MNITENAVANQILNDRFHRLTGLSAGDFEYLCKWYDKPPRYYHTSEHVEHLCKLILNDGYGDDFTRTLLLAAVFHDAVYDPKSTTNEEDSAEFFLKFIG